MKMWREQPLLLENEVVFGWQIIRLLHFMGTAFLCFILPPSFIYIFLSFFSKSTERVQGALAHIQLT